MTVLLRETTGAVTTVTINRPEAFNALDAAVIGALTTAVTDAAEDPGVRAVVLTGSGRRHSAPVRI